MAASQWSKHALWSMSSSSARRNLPLPQTETLSQKPHPRRRAREDDDSRRASRVARDRLGCADLLADAGEQRLHADGLLQTAIGADGKRLVIGLRPGGPEHDWQGPRGLVADAPDELVILDVSRTVVEENEIDAAFLYDGEARSDIGHREHCITFIPQELAGQGANARVVVDDQDRFGGNGSLLSAQQGRRRFWVSIMSLARKAFDVRQEARRFRPM